MKKLVAMSGGVDSSVAAYLIKKQGNEPVGVTMMLHDNDLACKVGTHSCCTPDDIEDARVVSSNLGIPFHVVNYLEGFREKVIHKFIKTYLAGETPNPCIDCNRYMKFGKLFEMAEEEGCEKVVTGHYATVEPDDKTGRYRLKRSVDRTKDQTYVLYFLNQEQLSRLEFPLGVYEKNNVREIADEIGLMVATKHDSQDICFVPDGDYAGYIENEGRDEAEKILGGDPIPGKGEFLDIDGKLLGYHKGYFHYTIGQRKGLGISAERPLYVVDIIPKRNEVILGSNDDLFTKEVHATQFNLISMPEEDKIISGKNDDNADIVLKVSAKVRYRAVDTPGVLTLHSDGTADMLFDEPVRAVTPGQSLVIYDGEYCLGGGIIKC